MQWFYVKNGAQTGPVSEDDFSAMISSGEITGQTLVWNETMKDWRPYATLSAGSAPAESPSGAACSMCGQHVAENELIQFEGKQVCAACKPEFLQQIKENSEISGVSIMRYAGFWIRFAAMFIDGIILNVINLPVGFLFGLLMPALANAQKNPSDALFWPALMTLYLLQAILPALYSILMIGKYGATLGKKAVGIKVVLSDGSPVSYGRATGRFFSKFLSAIILYIGYIMAGFDEEKRALHDRICNTRVVYK